MRDALKHHRTAGSTALPGCRARHPHLGLFEPKGCAAAVRAMVLGASNQWFSLLVKALYIPALGTELVALVDKHWDRLFKVSSVDILSFALDTMPELSTAAHTRSGGDLGGNPSQAEGRRRSTGRASGPYGA